MVISGILFFISVSVVRIFAVNDTSDDRSLSIIAKISQKDPCIPVRFEKNLGSETDKHPAFSGNEISIWISPL
jgi:hypothetical protein